MASTLRAMSLTTCLGLGTTLAAPISLAVPLNDRVKPASEATVAQHQHSRAQLPFDDQEDFALAHHGFIASEERRAILDAQGNVVWVLGQMEYLDQGLDRVHPRLQRQSLLMSQHGLYQLTDGVYQVRGYDRTHITFIEGDQGWVVIDALGTAETAEAAWQLLTSQLGERPIQALILTEADNDRSGGAEGLLAAANTDPSQVTVLAPRDFQQGQSLHTEQNTVGPIHRDASDRILAPKAASGERNIVHPNLELEQDSTHMVLDGVDLVLTHLPGEPEGLSLYLPQQRLLWLPSYYQSGSQNLRAPLAWSQMMHRWLLTVGDEVEILCGSDGWPQWQNERVTRWLAKERDYYGYLSQQALRLSQQGQDLSALSVPEALESPWLNRGRLGAEVIAKAALAHQPGLQVVAPIPSEPRMASRYVEVMGGKAEVLTLAHEAQRQGEYGWCAELAGHLVQAFPRSESARYQLADCLEQLAYQSDSVVVRQANLTQVEQLRYDTGLSIIHSTDDLAGWSSSQLLHRLALQLDGAEAARAGLAFELDLVVPDKAERFRLTLRHGHLASLSIEPGTEPAISTDLKLVIHHEELVALVSEQVSLAQLLESERVLLQGQGEALLAMEAHMGLETVRRGALVKM